MKRLSALAATLLIFACTDVPTQPGELPDLRVDQQAYIMDGLPGNQPIVWAGIDIPNSHCEAWYADPIPPNSAINSRFLPAEDIRVVKNRNKIKATCTFLDTSGAYEANAETGVIEDCTLVLEDGTVYEGGTGRITSAANIVDEVDGLPFGTGGNTTMQCTFSLK
jgi:hypothetical protein